MVRVTLSCLHSHAISLSHLTCGSFDSLAWQDNKGPDDQQVTSRRIFAGVSAFERIKCATP
jgi:hypothetical protein